MGQKKNIIKYILILTVLMSGSLWFHFFVLDALPYVCTVRCGRPAVFVWLCKLHTIEDPVLYYATVISSTNIFKVEKSRRLHACTLLESMFNIYTVYCMF